MLLLILNKKN